MYFKLTYMYMYLHRINRLAMAYLHFAWPLQTARSNQGGISWKLKGCKRLIRCGQPSARGGTGRDAQTIAETSKEFEEGLNAIRLARGRSRTDVWRWTHSTNTCCWRNMTLTLTRKQTKVVEIKNTESTDNITDIRTYLHVDVIYGTCFYPVT